MYKTMTVLVCAFFVLLSLSAMTDSAMADNLLWTNGTGDGLWNTQDNWSPPYIPEIWYNDKVQINSISGPLINASMTEHPTPQCQWLALSDGGEGDLFMTGGTLEVNTPPAGGDSWFIIAYGEYDVGTFMLDGGTVITGNRVFVGFKGWGILKMTGGEFNIGGMFGIGYCSTGWTDGQGDVLLEGGTIRAADFQMSYPPEVFSHLDISGGALIIDGDKRTLIESYIADDRIVAYDGNGGVSVDYNNINIGKTTVKGSMDLTKAYNPSPADNAENVVPDANLSWTAGVGATSHDVYFGTTNPPDSIGNQDTNSYDPNILDFETTYYWRINEVNEANTVIGNVWKFTTVSEKATNPDPNDGATNVALDKMLSWTPGYDANTHDVYLGTDENSIRLTGDLDLNGIVDWADLAIFADYWLDPNSGSPADFDGQGQVDSRDFAALAANWMMDSNSFFKGNQDSNSFDPNGLEPETIYYWRIDEINGSGKKTKGNTWSFNTHYSLIGKVMCGYQGWFNCPGDGSGRGWVHWGNGSFSPTSCNVDLWPDMTEYGVDEKFLASAFNDANGTHYVFSPYKRDTVLRHFQWMADYGIDGVYLQRFATETTPGTLPFYHRNTVLSHCKEGANMYGRKYAVMYDLTGLGAGGTQTVIDDWKFLVDTMNVTRDPNDNGYMFHKGHPVVALWGFGFGRDYEGDESYNLINFFKNDPNYGGCTIMLGVNNDWRSGASVEERTLLLADIISPWSVGRYKYLVEINAFTNDVWIPDILWCQTNSTPSHLIEYLPVIWPGFSFHNADPDKPFNEMPRNGGQFLWNQVYATVSTVQANMLYIAMFDEVDEGTAIFKITNNPPRPGGVDMFVTPSYDGIPLPSDEYLWLVGQAGRALRGEITLDPNRPVRP
jgi:glycoprotein endo-alpha-1,2-mannosidase